MTIPIQELIEREMSKPEGRDNTTMYGIYGPNSRNIYGHLDEESPLVDPPFEIVPDTSSESVQRFLEELRQDTEGVIPRWTRVYQAVYNKMRYFKRSKRDLLEIGGYDNSEKQAQKPVIPLSRFLIAGKGNCLEKAILAQLAFQNSGEESYVVVGNYGEMTLPNYHAFNLVNIDGVVNLMDIPNPKGPEIQRLSAQDIMERAFVLPVGEVEDNYRFDAKSEFRGKPTERTYWFKVGFDPFMRWY